LFRGDATLERWLVAAAVNSTATLRISEPSGGSINYHRHDGKEAEWTMGVPWLGLCWHKLGDKARAKEYLKWTDKLYWGDHLPECYTGTIPCEHTPLAWSHSLAVALRAAVQ
jgi:hypothetical protein